MKKKSIEAIDVRDRRVLVRLDLNVPLDAQGAITDDRRIRGALPTVRRLLEGGGRVILMSHLGRPSSREEDRKKYSLSPVVKRLGEILDRDVRFVDDCVGPAVRTAVHDLKDGEVCLLENLRFHAEETIKDRKALEDAGLRQRKEAFASQLAELADVYVNDAFGTCHRDNASMLTVPQQMRGKPRVVGFLVQKELAFLGEAVSKPVRPFVCVLGGAKVSDKLGVIRSLIQKCDTILIGGAMAYTFLAAEGIDVGTSLVEADLLETARTLRNEAGTMLRLPVDSVVADTIEKGVETRVCESSIPAGLKGLDIGPRTVAAFREVLADARTIVWNGPMGVFEVPPFDAGTVAMAMAIAEATDRGAKSIIGGGDSAAAVEQAGVADRVSHVSTGGGASLEFLEGKRFAALDVLDDA